MDGNGAPLAVRISAGNENEQRHFLPLVDRLLQDGIHPDQVWADRGYWAKALRDGLTDRRIEPRISRKRRPNEPIPEGVPTTELARGKKRTIRPRDLEGRHRWQIERTNAWIHVWRRIHIRRDVKAENYTALLTIVLSVILARNFSVELLAPICRGAWVPCGVWSMRHGPRVFRDGFRGAPGERFGAWRPDAHADTLSCGSVRGMCAFARVPCGFGSSCSESDA